MSVSTGERCLKTKQYLSESNIVTNKKLLGIIINYDTLDELLQLEIEKTGCDIPVFRKQEKLLKIYFSCCDKDQVILLEVSIGNEKFFDLITHEILSCFLHKKTA